MDSFVYPQIFNSFVCFVSAWYWANQVPKTIILKQRLKGIDVASFATTCCFVVSLWYGIVYTVLGFNLVDIDLKSTVPFFRYTFPILVLSPVFRSLSLEPLINTIIRYQKRINKEKLGQ